MAELIFNKFAKKHIAKSAGIIPGRWEGKNLLKANHMIECLNEIGIDASENKSKKLINSMVKSSDRVFVLGVEKKLWPNYLLKSKKVTYWNIEDISYKRMNKHRKIRDKITENILKLFKEIGY